MANCALCLFLSLALITACSSDDSSPATDPGDITEDAVTGTDTTDPGADTTEEDDTNDTPSEICDDNVDNDGDQLVDLDDPDCDTPCVEDCSNGVDDCGDGLVDCADPQCVNSIACSEDCDSGIDEDNDGLTDCEDADQCEFDEACNPLSCGIYFDCLVEQGCDCDLAAGTCPEDITPCQQNCFANDGCEQVCVSETGEFEDELAAWNTCTADNCAGAEDFVDCFLDACLEEYAYCFQVGYPNQSFSTCNEYFGCTASCAAGDAGDACRSVCTGSLTAEPWLDLFEWDSCRFELCDTDDDGTTDSTACIVTTSFLVCGAEESAGTCASWYTEGGTKGCADLVTCTTACEDPGDQDCLLACLEDTPAAVFAEIAPVYECFISECGSFEDELTSECFLAASEGACADVYGACVGTTSTASLRTMITWPESPLVDGYYGDADEAAFQSADFGKSSDYAPVPAGLLDVSLYPSGGTREPYLTAEGLELEAGASYTGVAVGTLASEDEFDPELLLLTDDRTESVGDGMIHLRVVHAAPTAGVVDLWSLSGETPTTLAADLAYGAASDYLPLEADTAYSWGVDTDDDEVPDLLLDVPTYPAGSVITYYIATVLNFELELGVLVQNEASTVSAIGFELPEE